MPRQPIKYYQAGSFVAGNRLLDPDERSVQARMDRSNSLTSGHRACQGCGEALGARTAIDAALRASDGRLVAANATGCLEVFSTPFPETSWQLPWIHSLFGNAPAVATGMAAALRAKGRDDVRVVSQGGDGATVDIGFACLSGMFERNDDVLYICYDNEAYMNTGVQRSGATPPAARTSTTQIVGDEPGNVFGQGKNVPLIAMAHEIPYVGTATIADLRDLEYKVERAMEMRGARYLHVFVTCPLGWGSASRDSIRVARLAKESGLFPVFEAERGEVVGVSPIRRRVPVEEYLKLQRRFGHLFGDPPRIDVIARIQAIADRNIERFGLVDEDTVSATLSAAEPAGLRLPAKEAARAAQLVSEDTGASRLAEETTQGASTAGPEPLRLPEDAVERGANATSPDDEPYRALDEKTRRAR
jgi:pyruvate ferredoxin oxidoreductase beta subunit